MISHFAASETRADIVLLVQMWGRLSAEQQGRGAVDASNAGGSGLNFGVGGGSARRGNKGGGGPKPAPGPSSSEREALEIDATFFSREPAALRGHVRLRYTGTSMDEALSMFGAKLREVVPRMRCVGWSPVPAR